MFSSHARFLRPVTCPPSGRITAAGHSAHFSSGKALALLACGLGRSTSLLIATCLGMLNYSKVGDPATSPSGLACICTRQRLEADLKTPNTPQGGTALLHLACVFSLIYLIVNKNGPALIGPSFADSFQ